MHMRFASSRQRSCSLPCVRGGTARGVVLAALLSATAFVPLDRAVGQGWSDPVTTTPSFIQKQFGPYGGVLPAEGENYCGPVATAMGLYYLGHNGYTQIAPPTYTPGNVAAADSATGSLTVFNPYPSLFVSSAANVPSSNPQVVGTSSLPADWTLVIGGQSASSLTHYAQIQSGTTVGDLSNLKGIMEFALGWSVDRSALPTDPGYGIDDWLITTTQVLNTNAGSLDVLARLTGTGGIAKVGLGTLLLTNDNLLTGSNSLAGGTLASSFAGGTAQAPGTPFGTGSVGGEMSSVLDFRPDDATPRAIHFTLAANAGSTFRIDAGGTEIHLAKGANPSLTVTVGGNADGVTPNLASANQGHVEILVGDGLASLGGTTKLLVAGSGANLPAVTNGMVLPLILGKDNDLDETASFLTYDATAGFLPATPILASAVGINDPSISATTIYRADTSQWPHRLASSGGARSRATAPSPALPPFGVTSARARLPAPSASTARRISTDRPSIGGSTPLPIMRRRRARPTGIPWPSVARRNLGGRMHRCRSFWSLPTESAPSRAIPFGTSPTPGRCLAWTVNGQASPVPATFRSWRANSGFSGTA
jgi:hypothetical protein